MRTPAQSKVHVTKKLIHLVPACRCTRSQGEWGSAGRAGPSAAGSPCYDISWSSAASSRLPGICRFGGLSRCERSSVRRCASQCAPGGSSHGGASGPPGSCTEPKPAREVAQEQHQARLQHSWQCHRHQRWPHVSGQTALFVSGVP